MSEAAVLRPAAAPADMDTVRALFLEYGQSLSFSLCFQGFEAELAGLPGAYAAPRGDIMLAESGRAAVGVAALRPLAEPAACEMKRLYVRPAWRGRGLGEHLARAVIAAARTKGYRVIRLDTHDSMAAAITLYRALGFRETPPYAADDVGGPNRLRYFEFVLNPGV